MKAEIEWHEGPARGGEGRAGKDENGVAQWFDGETLLIIVEMESGIEMAVVSIACDEDYFRVTDQSTGDIYDAWEPAQWSWWARIDGKLPA